MVNTLDYVEELFTPAGFANPHPILARMRREVPVYKLPQEELHTYPWMLTRYEDSINILKDDRFTKSIFRRPGNEHLSRNDPSLSAQATINRHMLTVDPPDHTRLRALVHKVFTPRMIRELEGGIRDITLDLLNRLPEHGTMDMILDFAAPLPITVIAELLGVPEADRPKFRDWTQAIVVEGIKPAGRERAGVAALEFIMYFHALFDKRRADPRNDLISGLVQVEEAGDKLDAQELISMVFLLMVAGHETTVNLLANGTLALIQHRDQLEMLRANLGLIENAIEEILRFDGPVGVSTSRWALEDVEINGQIIPKGEMVMSSLLAANRDPAVFENPDVFDITREPSRHIAFGHGIHYCLGAPLARLEAAVAFPLLLERLPDIDLAVNFDDIVWNDTLLLHGMKSMPVVF